MLHHATCTCSHNTFDTTNTHEQKHAMAMNEDRASAIDQPTVATNRKPASGDPTQHQPWTQRPRHDVQADTNPGQDVTKPDQISQFVLRLLCHHLNVPSPS